MVWFETANGYFGVGMPGSRQCSKSFRPSEAVVRCSTEGKVGSTDCPLSCPPLVLHISTASSTSSLQTGPLCMNTVCVWRGSGQGRDPIFILPFCPRFNFAGKCESFLKLSSRASASPNPTVPAVHHTQTQTQWNFRHKGLIWLLVLFYKAVQTMMLC